MVLSRLRLSLVLTCLLAASPPQGTSDAKTALVLIDIQNFSLPFPYSSGVEASRHRHMRELRIQHGGRPFRVLYAFDPRRAAILLLGGDKTGNARWYDENVPRADALYEEYLREIEREG